MWHTKDWPRTLRLFTPHVLVLPSPSKILDSIKSLNWVSSSSWSLLISLFFSQKTPNPSSCWWFPSWLLQLLPFPTSLCDLSLEFHLSPFPAGFIAQALSSAIFSGAWAKVKHQSRALCPCLCVPPAGRKFWQNSPSESQFYFSKRQSEKHHGERWTEAILLEMSEYKSKLLHLNSPRKYTLTVKANDWESQMRC